MRMTKMTEESTLLFHRSLREVDEDAEDELDTVEDVMGGEVDELEEDLR